jgi:hypothetical protein
VADPVLFGFIASSLMAQDSSLSEESAVDDEFALLLTRSNSIQKSLTVAMTRTTAKTSGPGEAQPPRQPPRVPEGQKECPKCHFWHPLRECTAAYATFSRDGPRNFDWSERPPRRGGGGRGAPYGARPAIMAP